jgi:8-oxo-dGTP diphosphatase
VAVDASRRIEVVAGVLRDAAGRVLICQRPPGKPMAGDWEFPGGKRHTGESALAALSRELHEELGIRLGHARPLIRYAHAYPERSVALDVWQVEHYDGRPHGREGQALEWVAIDALPGRALLPADGPIVTALRLGSLCVVTGPYADPEDYRARLGRALARGARLVQIRDHTLDERRLTRCVEMTIDLCREHHAWVVINGDPAITMPIVSATGADGLHLPARYLRGSRPPGYPDGRLLGASCHDARELRRAAALGADYAFLGPVCSTGSHPGAPGIGWPAFARLVDPVAMPVYAIGGLSPASLEAAWQHGGQGIAAITSLWTDSAGSAQGAAAASSGRNTR